MGFGSYDESEQRDPEIASDEGEEESVQLHQNDYEGDVSFESGASTDDLLDGLSEIKADAEADGE